MARSVSFFHVFRFQVLLNGESLPSESLLWEWQGDTLVLSRGMQVEPERKPLMDAMFDALCDPPTPPGHGIISRARVRADRRIEICLETRERRNAVAKAMQEGQTANVDEVVGSKGLMLWRLEFDRIVNRGFSFLHAGQDDIVREAIAFVGARIIRVRP